MPRKSNRTPASSAPTKQYRGIRRLNNPIEIWENKGARFEWRVLKKHDENLWYIAEKSPLTNGQWKYRDIPSKSIRACGIKIFPEVKEVRLEKIGRRYYPMG